ncbi:MAG: hypothetical protein ABI140_12555, partial [Jatrophihabitantaceae bacterium]
MSTERTTGRRRTGRRWLAAACALAATTIGFSLSATGNSAQAAVPDKFGFVLWNGAATVGSGTWPAATTVTVLGVGQYLVNFPGQAIPGGTAHVTAINSAPHWCQLNNFGPSGADEVVTISCYKVGGVLDPTAFSAIFDASSGPASSVGSFGYVNSQASGSIISQYNSAGLGNSVTHSGIGQWTVKFPGLATPGPIDGSLQATAVSQQIPARCKVLSWSSSPGGQVAQVTCFGATGAPFDTQFTLTYQYQRSLYGAAIPPKYFGYLWNVPPVGPASTNFNNPLGPGANSVAASGLGLSIVKFPQLAVLPDDIQVTAAGKLADFCGLDNIWTHSGPDTLVRNV